MGLIPAESFPDAARRTLADSQLRVNLHHATRTIRAKRAAVVAELGDWEQLRAAGAAIKDRALLSLDAQLERLESEVGRRGGVVHWARNGAEANRIVCDIAHAHGVDEVVKVKSIATDEIELNEALAAAGVAAIETDLAELIIQLGNDMQSHILVPAIHRNRAEIRELFLRELDVEELGHEPAALAEAARAHLRRKFLAARMGISGANFAIAETGTVCVVESEGNGRMCTTLPDVLVTVMGVEKLVVEWADMEAMLQLLPRSSTGERMNPYTSFWSGVRDGDGPSEFHLVLLDNGRTDALADELGRQALRCIRCSACLNVCPVYERTGGHAYGSVYPGPIGAILTPQLAGVENARSLPFASSLCGACGDVCPVKIEIPKLLVHLRAKSVESRSRLDPERITMAGLYRVFRSRRAYEAAQHAGRIAQKPLEHDGMISRGVGPLAAWTNVRDLPAIPDQTFREWWRDRSADSSPREDASPAGIGPATDAAASAALGERVRRIRPSARAERASAAQRTARDGAGADVRPERAPQTERNAREDVLARVRAAIGDADALAVPRDYRRVDDASATAIVDRFEQRAGDYNASVRRVEASELREALRAACLKHGVHRVGVPSGLPDAWLPDGVETVLDEGLSPRELDALDGALTGCALAIAETGTIVLDGGLGQGRRALTLVPDLHVCVVDAQRIVGLVPEAVERLGPVVGEGRPLTFVSGPSATSDIELSRVEGVHGPRRLEVLVVTGLSGPAPAEPN